MAYYKIMLKDPMTGDHLLPATSVNSIYNEDGTLWTPPPVTDLSGYLKTIDADAKYAVINHTHTTAQITGLDTSIQAINTEISSLKSSVSSGKATIAAAVTDKGVQTAADATFEQMATNIAAIASLLGYVTGTVKINTSNSNKVTIPDLVGKDNFIFVLEIPGYHPDPSSIPNRTVAVYKIGTISHITNTSRLSWNSTSFNYDKETGTIEPISTGYYNDVGFVFYNDTYPSTFRYFGW